MQARFSKEISVVDLVLVAAQLLVTIGLSFVTLSYEWVVEMFGYQLVVTEDRYWLWIVVFVVFGVRYLITYFYLMERSLDRMEVFGVAPMLGVVFFVYAFNGATTEESLGVYDLALFGLYLVGSYWNTGSEYMRKQWKKKPENKGKLYTLGLNQYCQHPNYFGDMILYTAVSLLAHNNYLLLIPSFMTLGFIYQHIPELDQYIANRYPEYPTYDKNVKKLIPFIY